MITCKSALSLIEPYVDGELDAAQRAGVETHLDECPNCAAVHQQLLALRNDLQTLAPRYTAPAGLEKRVLGSVRQAARPRSPFNAWAIAASVLLAVSVGGNVMLLRSPHRDAADPIAQEIVASHIRSLIGTHLLDVPSTDRHTVKPWFNGRLDYSPEVKDFAAAGFPLIGGRVDYLDHKPVAALVYQRRGHVINLFTWPSNAAIAAPEAANGYNFAVWSKAGMNYCAISDLNKEELRQFVDLYQ